MHRIRHLLPVLVLAITASAAFAASPLDDGMEAFRTKDYARAAELWRPLAQAGDPMAQYRLGTLYAEGLGVDHDDEQAFTWFMRAAEKGNPDAQYDVAASYMGGTGVKASQADAIKWFQRAANQGMPFAQLNLGLLYASGTGVSQDNIEALKWLDLALVGLPPGGPRSDVARAIVDVTQKMKSEEIDEGKSRARRFRAKPEQ
jgi:hypothetical protein